MRGSLSRGGDSCDITERYGLFTLILLGESLLASANAIFEALDTGEEIGSLVSLAALAFLSTAALWWICFWPPQHRPVGSYAGTLTYGYGHFFIFAAAVAFSVGIEVEIDILNGHSALHQPWASFAFTIPVAAFVLGIWLLALRPNADRVVNVVVPVADLLVLVDPLIPVPFALTALILAATVAVLVWRRPARIERPTEWGSGGVGGFGRSFPRQS